MNALSLPGLAPRTWRSFDSRSSEAEVMDASWMPGRDYQQCLSDLAAVNRVTFTHRPTLRWLARQLPRIDRSRPLVILDVGFGQGDLLRAIAGWARRERVAVELHGVDLNPRSAHAAAALTPRAAQVHFHTADVFAFVPPVRPDFIVSSQFTHHLEDAEVVRLVRWFEETAQRGWFITDLERSRFAWHAFPLLCALAGWHEVVRRDGQVSIARAFRSEDWRRLLTHAGVAGRVERSVLFRHCISST